ncbi:hypothetical protein SGGMMB4_02898 [Sodalis glossinidius str. 'morsitans']|uniref:Type III secretion chaperone n=1 Tax=Sodalis glossinidius (strain morsitans) TaxID=343509 RepID=Q2NTG3_SODGM|nr:CesD/SycD/LcrH family type III secretion system chaperone SscA [Sodalis glossinidius]BAE74562.1 putative type III secretion chaperone [Sodalis glossinidius str. 'morsitans']CRL45283.1 hypothetical protein SGGMMB4_02898 [Sodalis glossinidius str. 'morsitans']
MTSSGYKGQPNTWQDKLAVSDFLRQGGSVYMLLDRQIEESLQTLFDYAKQSAAAGDQAGAAKLFKLLTFYDAWSFDYWFHLGKCCQAQRVWIDAIYAYGRAAQIKVASPEAPCAAGECYLAGGNKTYARKAFHAALLICGELKQNQAVRQRSRAGLAAMGDGDESISD